MKWPKFIVLDKQDGTQAVLTLQPEQSETDETVAFYADRNEESVWHERVKFCCGRMIDMPNQPVYGFVYYTPKEDPLIVEMVMAKFLAARPGRSKKKQPAGK